MGNKHGLGMVALLAVGSACDVGAPLESALVDGVRLDLAGAVHVFAVDRTAALPRARLQAPNAGVFDGFGLAVEASTFVAVGAPYEASSGTTLDTDDDTLPGAGAAYTF